MDEKPKKCRSIVERWVVKGTLVLKSPASFAGGEADPLTDMPLLRDEKTRNPLLPGASIAGALRNYLRERQADYGKSFPTLANDVDVQRERNYAATQLFGGFRGDDDGAQSPLIVFDSVSEIFGAELRDGVKIDPETRTAEDEKKFDMQLLAAGSKFPLRFDLLVSGDGQPLRDALATALDGLEQGEITLGGRKRRGFGQVTVENWQVYKYNLREKDGLLDWLASEHNWRGAKQPQPGKTIFEMLGNTQKSADQRSAVRLSANFTLDGSMLIRAGFGSSDKGPDTVHLHTKSVGAQLPVPVIPGTSWAGVLRHRALKIVRTVLENPKKDAAKWVSNVFGPDDIRGKNREDVRASRVQIAESEIVDASSLVMTRVKIDRFTGGAFESALFSEQPVIGKPGAKNVRLDLTLRSPQAAEIGLLLLLLKDLWTGDLPVGGEASVGRGRLKGVDATLQWKDASWVFHAKGSDAIELETSQGAPDVQSFVDVFNQEMAGTV